MISKRSGSPSTNMTGAELLHGQPFGSVTPLHPSPDSMDRRNTGDTAFVQKDDCLEANGHLGLPRLITEASDLGWPPGYRPGFIVVEPTVGNGQPFTLRTNDEQVKVYKQMLGLWELHVLND